MNRYQRRLRYESLESKRVLNGMSFVSQDISVRSNAPLANSAIIADLNGDERPDVIYATAESIVWHANTDGNAVFSSEQRLIDDVGSGSLSVADVDGDNDKDVIAVTSIAEDHGLFRSRVVWYENTDGKGTFGRQHMVTENRGGFAISTADVDGDGDVDLLAVAGEVGAWYENMDGLGTFDQLKTIHAKASVVLPADIDGDGDNDVLIVTGTRISDRIIAWKENEDGKGTFGELQAIAPTAYGSITVADIDNDGDVDLVSASTFFDTGDLSWFENSSGSFQQHLISSEPAGLARVSDVDGDGDLDVISSGQTGRYGVSWYENINSTGKFSEPKVIDTRGDLHSLTTADLDHDGDEDLLISSLNDSEVVWYRNSDGLGSFALQPRISSGSTLQRPQQLRIADIDRDGDKDIVASSRSQIVWFENTGMRKFKERQVIARDVPLWSISTVDVDGDGDVDVISAKGALGSAPNSVSWYENVDGLGTFARPREISNHRSMLVHTDDVDGDGDNDVIFHVEGTLKLAWSVNADGEGSFGDPQVIAPTVNDAFCGVGVCGVRSVSTADLDGDGDLDIAAADDRTDRVIWFENTDGSGTFSEPISIVSNIQSPGAVFTEDIDGDGDSDVTYSTANGQIFWVENRDGHGAFGPPQLVGSDAVVMFTAETMSVVDLEGDGDLDIVAITADAVVWYENTDGKGTFNDQQRIADVDSAWAVYAGDLDEDGDVDVLSLDDSRSNGDGVITWHEHRLTGDVDNNGEVGFADFLVLATNFGRSGAGWAEGDLDNDGEVSFADFLILSARFGNGRPTVATVGDVGPPIDNP